MLTEEINKYKELYSQLISEFAGLHNTHMGFVKHTGRETGFATRKHLSNIVHLANEMRKQGRSVYKESIENKRLEKIRLKEEKRNKKKRR
jgi:hypothetical protein